MPLCHVFEAGSPIGIRISRIYGEQFQGIHWRGSMFSPFVIMYTLYKHYASLALH